MAAVTGRVPDEVAPFSPQALLLTADGRAALRRRPGRSRV